MCMNALASLFGGASAQKQPAAQVAVVPAAAPTKTAPTVAQTDTDTTDTGKVALGVTNKTDPLKRAGVPGLGL